MKLKELNNAVVAFYYMEIVENDAEAIEMGRPELEKVYQGYIGVIKGNLYSEFTEDGSFGKPESFDEISWALDEEIDEDYASDLDLEENIDVFARKVADDYRESVNDEGYGYCIHQGIIYVDIWQDGEKIYSGEF